MKLQNYIFVAVLAFIGMLPINGQVKKIDLSADKTAILSAHDTVTLAFDNDMTVVPIASNSDYSVTADADWITCKQLSNGNVSLMADYYYDALNPRMGIVTLESEDKTVSRAIVVKQTANQSVAALKGDIKLKIKSATASEAQGGEGIERSYDGNTETLWHSKWSGATFPVEIAYTLSEASHVDYLIYTPRTSGDNGNFQKIKVEYALATAPSQWITLTETDLEGSNNVARIEFGENGVDDVLKIRFIIKSGKNNFASCAEMAFYQKNNELTELFDRYFEDKICSKLKSGVTEEDLKDVPNAYVRQLMHHLLSGSYSTKYRVGTFEPYRPLDDLSRELKCGNYNRYENATGIYFTKGEKLVLFVDGLGKRSATLIIKSFAGPEGDHPESAYPLSDGINVITVQNRGNGYISYYPSDYADAPNLNIHFAMATENGYFDLQRGDTNEDWVNLLANAKSDAIDIISPRLHVVSTLSALRKVCPKKGVELATIHDNVVKYEREIMGLALFGREPKNRQFARPVDSGIYADGIGAAIWMEGIESWSNPDNFGYWGIAHELGHVNQTSPGFKWPGLGETSNNVYSVWVQHKMDTYNNLEDEHTGIEDYSGLRGGRFESYIDQGVRQGKCWQLQEGPDYYGSKNDIRNVEDEDYEGNKTGKMVNAPSRNYDHFVKLIPFWQLELYCLEIGKAPDAFGKVLEGVRTYPDEDKLSNGQLQIKWIRSFCDSTQINFLPFFEKAGMLRPINAYIEDYGRGWLKISEEMIDNLKTYIADKGYPTPNVELNYINAYNWQVYRDEAPLQQAGVGEGCTKVANGARIQVDGEVWKNAVAYETYDAAGNLLRITSYGLGAEQKTSRYTQVLWPANSAYIMAVGFDGTRYKCYEP